MKKIMKDEEMSALCVTLEAFQEEFNEWEEAENRKKEGPFAFLSDSLLVRKIVVSPNVKCYISTLKTMVVTECLEVYKDKKNARISYTTILNQMKGLNTKKYKFNYEILKKCFQVEANRDAFLSESRIIQTRKEYRELVEKCEDWLPYILLNQIREYAWELLDKYYFTCNKKFCNDCDKKKELYFSFTQVVAVFEILFITYVQEPIREIIQQSTEIMAETMKELQKLQGNVSKLSGRVETYADMNADEKYEQATKDVEDAMQNMLKLSDVTIAPMEQLANNFEKLTIYKLVEAEFSMELCALIHLLLVFETVNVYDDMKEKIQIGLNLDVNFRSSYDKNFRTFGRTNKNKSFCYNYVNKYLEEVLEEGASPGFDVKRSVISFLDELSIRNKGGQAQRFYMYMRSLAKPIYLKLGGENLE